MQARLQLDSSQCIHMMPAVNASFRHLTVRNVPRDVIAALRREARIRGLSVNATVLAVLKQALGLLPEQPRDNGIGRLAGHWTAEEAREFEEAIAPLGAVDEDLWR